MGSTATISDTTTTVHDFLASMTTMGTMDVGGVDAITGGRAHTSDRGEVYLADKKRSQIGAITAAVGPSGDCAFMRVALQRYRPDRRRQSKIDGPTRNDYGQLTEPDAKLPTANTGKNPDETSCRMQLSTVLGTLAKESCCRGRQVTRKL